MAHTPSRILQAMRLNPRGAVRVITKSLLESIFATAIFVAAMALLLRCAASATSMEGPVYLPEEVEAAIAQQTVDVEDDCAPWPDLLQHVVMEQMKVRVWSGVVSAGEPDEATVEMYVGIQDTDWTLLVRESGDEAQAYGCVMQTGTGGAFHQALPSVWRELRP